MQNHPITWMGKHFQIPEGLGATKYLCNEAKYAKYLAIWTANGILPTDDEDFDKEKGLHHQCFCESQTCLSK